jgi:hypothetical protein
MLSIIMLNAVMLSFVVLTPALTSVVVTDSDKYTKID